MTAEPSHTLPREVSQHIETLGQSVRTARLRRRMTQAELAQACGIGPRSVYRLEHGDAGIALGILASVLWKLGLLDTLGGVADPQADEHGQILEAAARPRRARTAAADNDF